LGQKAGDLVPWFAAQIIDAIASSRPFAEVLGLIATAFGFWVFHGNVLPYLLGRSDTR
jgi:hypothetical protein